MLMSEQGASINNSLSQVFIRQLFSYKWRIQFSLPRVIKHKQLKIFYTLIIKCTETLYVGQGVSQSI